MANTKISALPSATLPLAGTEVLPIVQSGTTDKVAVDDLTVKNVRSNATTGILQIAGPAAATTRVMTTPNANFTAARTDAGQTFTGNQVISSNLGIGQTTPVYPLDMLGNNGVARFNSVDANGNYLLFSNNGTAKAYAGTANQIISGGSADNWGLRTENIFVLATGGGTERARVDTSGNVLVGTTSTALSGNGVKLLPTTDGGAIRIGHPSGTSSGTVFAEFGYNGTQIGYIGQVGTTAVSYITTSDYRLKNTVTPMTGALAKVALLKPVTYKWNADGSDGQGFIAHELAEVCPDAVAGKKDAVDEEGNPKYQGIDTSFLVAILTAAIQEQQTIIESLKARLDAANL